jgi:hypothetical protein
MFQTIPSMPVLALVMPAVSCMNAPLHCPHRARIQSRSRRSRNRAGHHAGGEFDDSVNAHHR